MTTRQSTTVAGKAEPKFLVRCDCGTTEDGQEIPCGAKEHFGLGDLVAARCELCCDADAVVDRGEGGRLCDACANPCWKCDGSGCRACGQSGAESKRRILQNCAELPAFHVEEPTQDIPAETMAQAVLR